MLNLPKIGKPVGHTKAVLLYIEGFLSFLTFRISLTYSINITYVRQISSDRMESAKLKPRDHGLLYETYSAGRKDERIEKALGAFAEQLRDGKGLIVERSSFYPFTETVFNDPSTLDKSTMLIRENFGAILMSRHQNKGGQLGGFVEFQSVVDPDSFLFHNSFVGAASKLSPPSVIGAGVRIHSGVRVLSSEVYGHYVILKDSLIEQLTIGGPGGMIRGNFSPLRLHEYE